MHALNVHAPALAPQQHGSPAIAATHTGLRDLTNALPQGRLLGAAEANSDTSPGSRRCSAKPMCESSSSLRKNLETEPMFSQVRVDFWRWIELWSLRSAVDYAATSLGMRIRL